MTSSCAREEEEEKARLVDCAADADTTKPPIADGDTPSPAMSVSGSSQMQPEQRGPSQPPALSQLTL